MYELPEIVEVGQADELTLGLMNSPVVDGCDCVGPKKLEEVDT